MEDYSSAMFCDAVDELMDDIARTLHTVVDDMTLKLYGEFTERERQKIDGSGTDINKVTTFFTILKTKSADAHQKCLKVLEELKHKEVADKLREKMKSLLRTVPGKQKSGERE